LENPYFNTPPQPKYSKKYEVASIYNPVASLKLSMLDAYLQSLKNPVGKKELRERKSTTPRYQEERKKLKTLRR
jgi:hypothetical protein